jgi:hypothetical protein
VTSIIGTGTETYMSPEMKKLFIPNKKRREEKKACISE